MKRLCIGTLLLIFFFLFYSNFAAAHSANCGKKEEIIFSCSTGEKIISFCASAKGIHPAYLEYRFGTSKNIELSYRVNEGDFTSQINRASILGASGASTEIWFTNNGFSYVFGDPVNGDAALEIIKKKKLMARFICKKDFKGDSNTPNDLIESKKPSDYFQLYGYD